MTQSMRWSAYVRLTMAARSLLAGALCLALVGCDKDDDETTGDSSDETTAAESEGSTAAATESGGSESEGGALQIWSTCGDPVCSSYGGPFEGVPLCSDLGVNIGDACDDAAFQCDPVSDCNALLVCAADDPTMSEGGCPISRAEYKRDIQYLDADGLARARAELMNLRLATYRYRGARDDDRAHLGVILEDGSAREGHALWADETHNRVDLYGYASLAVATAQVQAEELELLRGELATMRARLSTLEQQQQPGACAPASVSTPAWP